MLKSNQTLSRNRQASSPHKEDTNNRPKNYSQKEIEKILKQTVFIKVNDNYSLLIKK